MRISDWSSDVCSSDLVALEKIAPASQFLVQIELESHQTGDFQRFENAVRAIPQVTRCVAVGGGVDYFLEVVARDVSAYQALIDDILERRIGVKRYFTFVVTKRSEEHTSELQSLMRISYAVFCLKKKKTNRNY